MNASLPSFLFSELAKFDSCSIANGVDMFRTRLQSEGFTGSGIACRTRFPAPMVGVASTLKVRSADPSMKPGFYLDSPDWWELIEAASFPRVLVIEDTDVHPGRGSLVGPVHACILKALGFVGVVTSGAVRGIRKFEEIGLHAFSGNVSPSHAFSHVVEVGGLVEIAGVKISHGDLIHGDHDGIVQIPDTLAEKVPEAARIVVERERGICAYCNSRVFSSEKLKGIIHADSSRW